MKFSGMSVMLLILILVVKFWLSVVLLVLSLFTTQYSGTKLQKYILLTPKIIHAASASKRVPGFEVILTVHRR